MTRKGFAVLVRATGGRRRALLFVIFALVLLPVEASTVLAGGGWNRLNGPSAPGPVPRAPETLTANTGGRVIVGRSARNDRSPALRNMRPAPPRWRPEHEASPNPKPTSTHVDAPDAARQMRQFGPNMPSPLLNFNGIPFPGVACACAPPDTNGEVGATQYVQMVNTGFQVFDKATGTSLLGPVDINTIWTGFGGVCEGDSQGDPVVVYDQLANRWVISQFAGNPGPLEPLTDECVAVSTSSDATGTWNRYDFHLGSDFFDYPKIGVWPDAYYMSMNVFNAAGTAFLGPQPFAFERAAMLAGNPATFITTRDPAVFSSSNDAILPADLDGATPPTSGAPEPFLMSGQDATWKLWRFHVDFGTPANSTFTLGGNLAPAAYTELCPTTRNCVPQLGTTTRLDGIGDRGMFRLAYRKFSDHEALVGNQTVSSNGVAGIRWYEIGNATSGTPAFTQESTYQPDTTWRWMGSVAMDRDGDLAVGFSASSAAINPQIRYAGRLAGDPPNTLAQGETTLFAGTGSQSDTFNRWGDYSDLTVDPVDDCTFWYTQEYYQSTSQFNWRTRIGSFKFPTCNSNVPFVVVSKTADESTVTAGDQAGFTVTLGNEGAVEAAGLAVTDTLPGGTGIDWTIDAANTEPGWSISGSAPNQSLVYSPTTLPAHTTTRAHVVSATTSAACGLTLSNTASFTTGNDGSGSASATINVLGAQTTFLSEKFDGVTAPSLPAGWSAVNDVGPAPPWTTSGSGTPSPAADSAPNAAFVNDPAVISDKRLTSPSIAIATASAQLTFRQNRDLESDPDSDYDGGVLEISLDGGAFQDILAAGGSFVIGGYNATISTSFDNPLAGRPAWSSNSNGFVTTTVNLPAAAAGHNVQLRWRMGSDTSEFRPGWRIDNVAVTDRPCAPPSATQLAIVKLPDAAHVTPGGQIGYKVTLSNTGPVTATGVTATDSLPGGPGLDWTLDAAGSSAGWSVAGSPPHQSVSYSPATLEAGTSTHVHVVSSTSASSCGSYRNTAGFTSSNGGSGNASAVLAVDCWALTVTRAGAGSGTVISAPSGIGCGTTCSAQFAGGTTVTLTATAGTGSTFAGWSGAGCSGAGACVIAMNAAKMVTATFALQSRNLTVTRRGNGRGRVSSAPGGIACPATCVSSFAYGTSVKLTVKPSANSVFSGWSGACSGSGPCLLSMTVNRSVTANFRAKCVVPDLLGLTLKKARVRLTRAHCTLGKVTRKLGSARAEGKVLAQKPKPRTKLRPGAKVNVTVGKG